jgi:TetR/AcrR family transcriptional regulator
MARTESDQRQRILEAAVRVFGNNGYGSATIRDIGKEAGVNSALLYYYFEDKKALYLEAILMVLGGFFDSLVAARGPMPDARARIRFLVDSLFDYYGEKPLWARFMAHTIIDHAALLGEALNTLVRTRAVIPIQVLQEGVVRGVLRPGNPVHVWWSILGMSFFSIQIQDILSQINPEGLPFEFPDIEERRDQIVDLLLNGLALPPTGEEEL